MNRRHPFKKRRGEGTPMIVAIVLVLLMLFCAIAEYSRIWIISQGVKEATQQAVLSTVNDNYDDVYAQLSRILGLSNDGESYMKYAEGQMEFSISDLTVEIQNNALASGQSAGYTAVAELELTVPVRFMGVDFPAAEMTLHTEAKYIPLF